MTQCATVVDSNHHETPIITISDDYFDKTTVIVVKLLQKHLQDVNVEDLEGQAAWAVGHLNQQLVPVLCKLIPAQHSRGHQQSAGVYDHKITIDDPDLNTLGHYLPWPEAAITAYSMFNYILEGNISWAPSVNGEVKI